MKKKFITFGSNKERFQKNLLRICNEAKDFDYFDEIIGFSEKDLIDDSNFWKNNGEFIINNKRGYGCWIWKPHLIYKELEKMNEGDILVYADSGCEINKNGKKRFLEYIDLLNNNEHGYGLISFYLEFKECFYTKKTIFDFFNVGDEIKNSFQNMATIQIIKKNKHSMDIIKKWSDITKNHILINDVLTNNEDPQFIDNRHDQSIYSVLVNIYGSIKIKDETYYGDDWSKGINFPILAKRL
jgi:hypothetical protein